MDVLNTGSVYIEFILAAFALIGSVYGFVRFSTKRLEEKIIEVTRPIQPDQNGGLSMTDLHKKVDHLIDRVSKIETRVEGVEQEAAQSLYLHKIIVERDQLGGMQHA